MELNFKKGYMNTARAAPFEFYNRERYHQSLDYQTPEQVFALAA